MHTYIQWETEVNTIYSTYLLSTHFKVCTGIAYFNCNNFTNLTNLFIFARISILTKLLISKHFPCFDSLNSTTLNITLLSYFQSQYAYSLTFFDINPSVTLHVIDKYNPL